MRYSSWDRHAEREHAKWGRHTQSVCPTLQVLDMSTLWGLLAKVCRTCSTDSAAHRQPLCCNFMYHSRIVLSVGGSVWHMVRNIRCTGTFDSLLANSNTQNAFLSPIHAMFRHDCPLAVKPASTPQRQLPKKTWDRFSSYWYDPLCCVCLGFCVAAFGISGQTYELPCILRR